MTIDNGSNNISIKEICGTECATANQGQAVLECLIPLLPTGLSLEIDFSGIEILTTRFLNIAIGQLFKFVTNDAEADMLQSRLHFYGLDEDDIERMREVIKRARVFHLRPEEYEKAIRNSFNRE